MPHKHTRKSEGDSKNFNLAPTAIARPLPAFSAKASAKASSGNKDDESSQQKLKRKRKPTTDDTPRAFARLMQRHTGQKVPSGLDDGARKTKKQKLQNEISQSEATTRAEGEKIYILPGESLADFSARVNQALPVGGLAHKAKKVDGIKERVTKTEKRLKKMYKEWRETEERRKDKLEEAQEKEEEEADEKEAENGGQRVEFPDGRRARKKRVVGEIEDDDADPWAVLTKKREEAGREAEAREAESKAKTKTRVGRLKGVNDVVLAPPTIKVVPKEKFKVRNGARVEVANVPTAAGSLKRREELGDARREVIERYRAMMKGGGS